MAAQDAPYDAIEADQALANNQIGASEEPTNVYLTALNDQGIDPNQQQDDGAEQSKSHSQASFELRQPLQLDHSNLYFYLRR